MTFAVVTGALLLAGCGGEPRTLSPEEAQELSDSFDTGVEERSLDWTADDQAFSQRLFALDFNLTPEDRDLMEGRVAGLHQEYRALQETWHFGDSVTAEDVTALEDLVVRMSEALGHDLAAEPDYSAREQSAEDAFLDLWYRLQANLTFDERAGLESQLPALYEQYLALERAWRSDRSVTAVDVATLEGIVTRMSEALFREMSVTRDYDDWYTTGWVQEDLEFFDLKSRFWGALSDDDWPLLNDESLTWVLIWSLDDVTWGRAATAEDIAALRDLIARVEAALGRDLGIE